MAAKTKKMKNWVKNALGNPQADAKEGLHVYGRIVRRTERAILFRVADNDIATEELAAREIWFPTSQVKISEDARGSQDMLTVPSWLFEAKVAEIKN